MKHRVVIVMGSSIVKMKVEILRTKAINGESNDFVEQSTFEMVSFLDSSIPLESLSHLPGTRRINIENWIEDYVNGLESKEKRNSYVSSCLPLTLLYTYIVC